MTGALAAWTGASPAGTRDRGELRAPGTARPAPAEVLTEAEWLGAAATGPATGPTPNLHARAPRGSPGPARPRSTKVVPTRVNRRTASEWLMTLCREGSGEPPAVRKGLDGTAKFDRIDYA